MSLSPNRLARLKRVREIEDIVGLSADEVLKVSAKDGSGVRELLDAIVERVPPPAGLPTDPLRALIFDAVYDEYRGIIVYLRVVDGTIRKKDSILMMGTGKVFEAIE